MASATASVLTHVWSPIDSRVVSFRKFDSYEAAVDAAAAARTGPLVAYPVPLTEDDTLPVGDYVYFPSGGRVSWEGPAGDTGGEGFGLNVSILPIADVRCMQNVRVTCHGESNIVYVVGFSNVKHTKPAWRDIILAGDVFKSKNGVMDDTPSSGAHIFQIRDGVMILPSLSMDAVHLSNTVTIANNPGFESGRGFRPGVCDLQLVQHASGLNFALKQTARKFAATPGADYRVLWSGYFGEYVDGTYVWYTNTCASSSACEYALTRLHVLQRQPVALLAPAAVRPSDSNIEVAVYADELDKVLCTFKTLPPDLKRYIDHYNTSRDAGRA